jgi:hypothetical protein
MHVADIVDVADVGGGASDVVPYAKQIRRRPVHNFDVSYIWALLHWDPSRPARHPDVAKHCLRVQMMHQTSGKRLKSSTFPPTLHAC